ncbi:MAG TPA: hypothetical protein VG839_07185 [Asticcacaulis sp.]|nr:hypothetical protein [Asticcacaulis sp.]
MLQSLWFPVLVVFVGVIWLVALLSGLGKPRRHRRRSQQGNDDSVIPFVWGGDDGDDGHHGLH